MGIQQQIEELLKKKGVAPPHMTEQEFMLEFSQRFDRELGPLLNKTAERITRDIVSDENARTGRSSVCRYAKEPLGQHCQPSIGCFDCPNYKPMPGWRRWLRAQINLEVISFIFLAGWVFIGVINPELRLSTVIGLFFILVIDRIMFHIAWKKRQKRLKDK